MEVLLFRASVAAFLTLATVGLGNLALALLGAGFPLVLALPFFASLWVALLLATIEAVRGSSGPEPLL